MSVTTHHPLYDKFLKRWKKADDSYDGQDQVKRRGEVYLHRTGGMIAAEKAGHKDVADKLYSAYIHRAQLPDIYTPSVIGLTALASRKSWEIELPPAMEYLRENAGSGVPLKGMQPKLIKAGLNHGRLGHFVDSDPLDGEVRIALYDAKSVINWKEGYREGLNHPKLVVLQESHEVDTNDDIFSHDFENHYRVLALEPIYADDLNEVIAGWNYRVRVYTPDDSTGEYVVLDGDDFPMDDFQEGVIPFTFQGSTGLEPDPDILPLEGMIDHCLKYYELSADLYHDIHMSNTSTPVALGFDKDDLQFAGAGSMIVTSKGPQEADFKFVSTDGAGQTAAMDMMLRQIESAEKQSHRMTQVTSGVEASSTTSQRMFTKTATLRSVEEHAVAALERDLKYIAIMKGLSPDEVSVVSQYSYTEKEIEATLLKAISDAAAIGTLHPSAAVEYMKTNGAYEEKTIEDMMGEIEAEQERLAADAVGMDEVG